MRLIFVFFFALLSLPGVAAIEKYTLQNGMKVLVKEDHRAPVAVSMIFYDVGSAYEPEGLTGISHALEHMMFKGTSTHPESIFSKTIAGLGGQENASTSQDYTVFYEEVAAGELPICLELEADRMQHLLFNKKDFIKELQVIREERRMRTDNNPQALLFERFQASAHLAAPYRHPVIGWMSDLQDMRVEDVEAWYQHFYAPNNATLIVVGDVAAKNVFHLAELYFGNIEKKPTFQPKMQKEPPQLGPKRIQVSVPAKLPMLIFGYTVPSYSTSKDPATPYALQLIAGILDAGDSSRFTKNLVRKERLAGNIAVFYNPYTRYQSQFMVFGIPTEKHSLEELKTAALRELQQLQKTPIPAAELVRVKTQLLAQKTFEKDSLHGQAMELGISEVLHLHLGSLDMYAKNIEAITPAQIQKTAQQFFIENSFTEAYLLPQSITSSLKEKK